MVLTELLAPAGSYDILVVAINAGADAVYIAGHRFGARAFAQNFTSEEIEKAVKYAHLNGSTIHVTVNTLFNTAEILDVLKYVQFLYRVGVDAVIVQDIGLVYLLNKFIPEMEIHASTQMTLRDYNSFLWAHDAGIKRIILPREMEVDEIKRVSDRLKKDKVDLDLEVFGHGSLCYCISGDCYMSSFISGRSANRGACAQPCRWKYDLVRENENGEYEEVINGIDSSFFFNSKDLCMIEYIPQLIEAGITSFKIEGRMKTAYYVATTVRAYRMAIDAYYADPENWKFNPIWLEELKKGSHRDYCTGFYFDRPDENAHNYESASYIRNYDFVGIVRDYDAENGLYIVEQRNKMFVKDKVEVIGPFKETTFANILEMYDEEGNPIESAPHARQIVKLKLDIKVDKDYMLRKPIVKINTI